MFIKQIVFLLLFNYLTLFLVGLKNEKMQQSTLIGNREKTNEHRQNHIIHFIFCSDLHYGLNRKYFRNDSNVSAVVVNAAMIEKMIILPKTRLPNDGGVSAGEKVGTMEAVIVTGDITNRQDAGVQSAAVSWGQFEEQYLNNLHLKIALGKKTKLLLTPGNHDISNAIGFPRPMFPLTDNAAMVGIYNHEMKPSVLKTKRDFNFQGDKIHYSVNFGGIHFLFVSAWPDSAERVWMQADLNMISNTMPAFIFTHSDPSIEARFFQNPNGDHQINAGDKFENLLEERFKDGNSVKDNSYIEQRGLAAFIKAHPNIKAYFHGHTNYAEFYDWYGPDSTISIPCFRVDSPMKGRISSKDESKISFHVISIDTASKKMTVRECLWNVHDKSSSNTVVWGIHRTISL